MKKVMNIAMIHDSIGDTMGGSSILTIRFAKLLQKRGHKVILLGSRSPNTPPVDYCDGLKRYRLFSIPFQKEISRNFYLEIPDLNTLKRIFQEEKIDIIHVMMPFVAAVRAIRVAKKMGIKVVMHTNMLPENFFMNVSKRLTSQRLRPLFYKYLLSVYNSADVLVCSTKFSEIDLKKRKIKVKTIVISNGVDTCKFKPDKKFYLKNSLKVLYVGRLDSEKNVETLIRAMSFVTKTDDKVTLDIVGDGTSFNELKKLVHKLNLENNVHLLGRKKYSEVNKFFNDSNVFVHPSVAEIEGMTVLEAMSSGKPILIADSKRSASRYFVDRNGFLFKAKDPVDLSKKILKILYHPKLQKKMGERSLKLVKKFDVNRSTEMLEKVYLKVLKEKKKEKVNNESLYQETYRRGLNLLKFLNVTNFFNKMPFRFKISKIDLPNIKIPNTGLSKTVFKKW